MVHYYRRKTEVMGLYLFIMNAKTLTWYGLPRAAWSQ